MQPYAIGVISENLRLKMQQKSTTRSIIEKDLKPKIAQINEQLDPHEQLKFIVLVDTPWGIENDMLTPTMKVKRNKIEEVFGPQEAQWYSQNQEFFWG